MKERLDKALKVASDRLRANWAQEAIKYPLDEEGDKRRREAAAKAAVLSDVIQSIKEQFKKQEV